MNKWFEIICTLFYQKSAADKKVELNKMHWMTNCNSNLLATINQHQPNY